MSSLTSKTEGQKAINPSSYDVLSVAITFNNDKTMEIKDLVMRFEINESLFSPYVKVKMRVLDGFGLIADGHVVGGEKITLQIGRVPIDTSEAEAFELNVRIAEIHDHSMPKIGLQSYSFSCLSEHAFINNSIVLNRPFNGTITDLITRICSSDLKQTIDFSNKSTDQVTGIYPNLKPYDAITWLLRNSADEGTPYFFYETIQEGLQFNSYKQLLDSDDFKQFNNSPYFKNEQATAGHYKELKDKIIKMSSEMDMSVFRSISNGVYASNTQTLDIATKTYVTTNNSFKEDLNTLNPRGKSFSNKIGFGETLLNENFKAKQFFITKNSKAFSDKNNYHNTIESSVSDKNSQFNNLRFMGLDIFVYGDFNLTVGKKVELEITKSTDANIQESDRKTGMIDILLSGKYMVTDIAHIFDGTEYLCDVGLQKDSLIFDLDSDIKIGKK